MGPNNSTVTMVVDIGEDNADNFSSSFPELRRLDNQKIMEEKGKSKKVEKKQKWGPVIPTRRSSRLVDNGKAMVANAQDFKRKWNLEDNKGINHKTHNIPSISKNLLVSVAKDIGVVVEDGNPILDNLVELDNSRMADNIARCKHVSCCTTTES